MRKLLASVCLVSSLTLSTGALGAASRLTIAADSMIGSTSLQAGTYSVEVSPTQDSVTLRRGKKVIATAPCSVTALATDVPADLATYTKAADGTLHVARILLASAKQEVRINGKVAAK